MFEDLDPILKNWPFEPGSIQVRTISGGDGRLKLQLRLDLGILQMETHGRPDGQAPHGCESLLDYYETLASGTEYECGPENFKLNTENCLKLQQEGIQYYHRYIAFFQLQDFKGVIRDTERNLRLFDFVVQYAERPEMATMFQQFRSYVLMMLTRARGMLAIQSNDYALALKHIQWGIREIRAFLEANGPTELLEQNAELNFLQNWIKDVEQQRPLTPREKLQRQMLEAVEKEDYERAARLRNALKELE